MAVAQRVDQYLADHHIPYDLVTHKHTPTSKGSAHAAHLPESSVAKAVVTRDRRDGAYVMAVVPADRSVNLDLLSQTAHRHLRLVNETGLGRLFPDCEVGAVPPLGEAYEMEVICDEALDGQEDVYLEAGDHEQLIHLDRKAYQTLSKDLHHAHISFTEGTVPDRQEWIWEQPFMQGMKKRYIPF